MPFEVPLVQQLTLTGVGSTGYIPYHPSYVPEEVTAGATEAVTPESQVASEPKGLE
jgi:hypothetical protein